MRIGLDFGGVGGKWLWATTGVDEVSEAVTSFAGLVCGRLLDEPEAAGGSRAA